MRIRILKNINVDVEKPRLGETWPTSYSRWSEIVVEQIYREGKTATFKTYDGDFILLVPIDAFEEIKNEKRASILL